MMVQQIQGLAANAEEDTSSIPGSHMMGGESLLPKAAL